MAEYENKGLVVTSKKQITTEKRDGTKEIKYKTVLSDGETKVTLESSNKNELLNGESIGMTLKQNQKTLLEIKE